ncbi:serine hydrolase domain-containing protein [Paenibacillus donghaensis]|uniref:Penicillin-binding protein n=1 Tax=Paenibacillus donghaensis TaxID=414771 RepID=A0A2Z2KGC3_9BACL|nr:serine hydrolase [Paenibacillus donghaensis]ASA23065.1 penicillin-binding protein [Paenibacillus donghaensis]
MNFGRLASQLAETATENTYSGTYLVQHNQQDIAAGSFGYANRAELLVNRSDTRFGIASGCKLFTAIAVCQLVEQGKLSLDSPLAACMDTAQFPLFDPAITVHQLLTHSSGIADYFDEELMDDFEELWITKPMYTLRRLADFVPMFSSQPMKFTPGERFHYNNAGFIVLGLLVEELSGMRFTDYVEQHIFRACGMEHSGYFAMDALPGNTALGYIEDEQGGWRTNVYSLPVQGGSDGGAFVTAPDMLLLWQALLDHRLLSPELTSLLLTPHMHEENEEYYGYGVWITKRGDEVFKYHVMGYDPGVSFHSAVYPASGVSAAMLSNASRGPFRLLETVEEFILE